MLLIADNHGRSKLEATPKGLNALRPCSARTFGCCRRETAGRICPHFHFSWNVHQSQKMPNHTNTWSCHTTNQKRDTSKKLCIPQIPNCNMLSGQLDCVMRRERKNFTFLLKAVVFGQPKVAQRTLPNFNNLSNLGCCTVYAEDWCGPHAEQFCRSFHTLETWIRIRAFPRWQATHSHCRSVCTASQWNQT